MAVSISQVCLATTVESVLQKLNPLDGFPAESSHWELADDVAGVQIIGSGEPQDENTGVDVLVPGYGKCVVARGALRTLEESGEEVDEDGITSLELKSVWIGPEEEPLYRLLELVGPTLTRLYISFAHEVHENRLDVTRVLEACPSLKILTVGQMVAKAAPFIESVRRVGICVEELDCNFDKPVEIIKELADMTSPLAHSVKRIRFYNGLFDREWSMRAVTRMLAVNNVLEVVEVMVSRQLVRQFSNALQRYNGTSLPVAREPFPLRQRLAFISVFNAGRRKAKKGKDAQVAGPPGLLDFSLGRHIVATIFAFAAERVQRRVILWD